MGEAHIQVLHVDDEPSMTELTASFLEREDDRFTVETATSAEEGLDVVDGCQPDCVVSDYNMPGVDGLEFLQAVREDNPDLPFILFTGKGSEEVASDAISAGATDYLQKQSGTEQYSLLANRIRNAVTQHRSERKLREAREEYTAVFENVQNGLMLVDIEDSGFRYQQCNPRGAELIGRERTEIIGGTPREVLGPENGQRVVGAYRKCLDEHEPVEYTVTLDLPVGCVTRECKVAPVSSSGDVDQLVVTFQDITEHQRRRAELEAERRFTTQALDTLEDLFYVVDTDGEFQRWNEQVLAVTGYTEAEFAQLDGLELFPEDERDAVASAARACLTDGESTVEADVLTRDGERIPYELHGARLTDSTGETTGVVGIGRDLTERRQRERRFQALVEESNDIISVVDSEGRYQYQSPSLERVLGHDPEETVGDLVWEYIHPDDHERIRQEFENWVTNPGQGTELVEYRARHADGSYRWMEARGNNHRDSGAVDGYIVNSRDVTDRKEREQELARTRDLLANIEELGDVGAWEYNSKTEQLTITDGTRRLYGLDPAADLTLDGALDAVHPADRDRLADRLDTCLETGEPYEMDVRLTTSDGEQRWLTARGERVETSGAGDVVRGYIQDITERRER
jgi:PAS domain S-box-containing protein